MEKISNEELIKLEKEYIFSSDNDEQDDILLIKKLLLGGLILSIQFEYINNKLECFQSWINLNLDDEDSIIDVLSSSYIDNDFKSYEDIISETFDMAQEKVKNYHWLVNQIDNLIDKCNSKNFDDNFVKSVFLSRI